MVNKLNKIFVLSLFLLTSMMLFSCSKSTPNETYVSNSNGVSFLSDETSIETIDGVIISFKRPRALSTAVVSTNTYGLMKTMGTSTHNLTLAIDGAHTPASFSMLEMFGSVVSNITIDSNLTYYKSETNTASGLTTHYYDCNVAGTRRGAAFTYSSSETSSANANAIMNTIEFN